MIFAPNSQLMFPNGNYFIDVFGSPLAAFSLRKLSSSFTGNCIRVRRSSDNAEQDIGFNGGSLDESALTTFIGANDGYVKTWYDQSGNNNDATETVTSDQPKIVTAGTVESLGGQPTIKGVATMTGMSIPSTTGLTDKTIISYTNTTLSGSSARIVTSYAGSGSINNEVVIQYNGSNDNYQDGTKAVSIANSAGNRLFFAYRNTSEIGLAINAGSVTTAASPINSNSNLLKLFEEGGTVLTETPQSISEAIIYSSDKSLSRADIETDLNNYYSIY